MEELQWAGRLGQKDAGFDFPDPLAAQQEKLSKDVGLGAQCSGFVPSKLF